MTTNTLPWAVYARVSTDEQAREGVSMESQQERCKALLQSKGILEPIIISDPGFSAKNLKRPGAERLLELMKNRSIAGVCIWRLDRLTRSVKDLMGLIEEFEKKGIKLASVTENLDTSTSTGRFFVSILGSFGQYERESISERVRAAMAYCKTQGSYTGGPWPAGLRVAVSGKKRTLEVNPVTGPIVAEAWGRCIAGASLGELSEWLNSKAVCTAKGKSFSRQTVFKLLQRQAYIGLLVDLETWNGARIALAGRRAKGRDGFGDGTRKHISRGTDRIWLLAHIGRCAKCQSPLLGVSGTGKSGQSYPYYRCARKSRLGGCDAKELPALAWEAVVLEGLSRLTGTRGPLLAAWAQERARNAQTSEFITEERGDLIRRRDGLRQQIGRLVDLLAKGDSLADAVRPRVAALDSEIRQVESSIAIYDGRLASASITEADLELRMEHLQAGLEHLHEQPAAAQQSVFQALIAEVSLAIGSPMHLKIWPSPMQGTAINQSLATADEGFVQPLPVVGAQGFEPR